MPFNALPKKDFRNRDSELNYLGRLAEFSKQGFSSNVVVEGARGIGKTELLKQIYHSLFWEKGSVVPFYYSFQRAALSGESFARHYFSKFVRQFIAFLKQDPHLAENKAVPIRRLLPLFSSIGHGWMIDLVEDLEEQLISGDVHSRLLGAVTVPVVAAQKSRMTVIVLLDDFHLASSLYGNRPGDMVGLVSLFEDSIKSPLCPHILTGAPEGAIESIFSDDSLRGTTERMTLLPLPEDDAFSLFSSICAKLGVTVDNRCVKFMRLLVGNPLYIRNMAKALWKLKRFTVTEQDFWDCYSFEVTGGDTAFYWSSVFGGFLSDAKHRVIALELLMSLMENHYGARHVDRLSVELNVPESELKTVVASLERGGMLKTSGGLCVPSDPVLEDYIRGMHMREIKGYEPEKVKSIIQHKRHTVSTEASSFEMVIPMAQDAELVAAKAVEQICSSIHLRPDLIGQLQLAIIEACLNAMEHSGSYDKKVRLKFSASPELLEISIESPGRPFVPENVQEPSIPEKLGSKDKRGWGLRLMREIMDEVTFRPYEGGTRVILTRKITPNEVMER